MKLIFSMLVQIKFRYYLSAVVILSAIWLTPYAITSALEERGHIGYGGEHLLIPLGIIIAIVLCNLCDKVSNTVERRHKRWGYPKK